MNGTINRHNCVFWVRENPNVMEERTVNFLVYLCGVVWVSEDLCDHYFFEGTVTGAVYLNIIREEIVPTVHQLYPGEDCFFFQQDGAPSLYHREVRKFLDETIVESRLG